MSQVKIHSTAAEVVISLPHSLGLDSRDKLWFLRYEKVPGIQERAKPTSDEASRVVEMLKQNESAHSDYFGIPVSDITLEWITAEIDTAEREHRPLAICSRCPSRGPGAPHIPMMDFRCDATDDGLKTLDAAMATIDIGGFILKSGRSYHFYGTKLLDEAQWQRFLGQSLLLKNLADWRYVGHCLVRGICTLRISAHPEFGSVPTVVALR
jgi:hypothetical protein